MPKQEGCNNIGSEVKTAKLVMRAGGDLGVDLGVSLCHQLRPTIVACSETATDGSQGGREHVHDDPGHKALCPGPYAQGQGGLRTGRCRG